MKKSKIPEMTNQQKIFVAIKIATWFFFVAALIVKQWPLAFFLGIFIVWDIYNIIKDYMRMKKDA